MRRTLVLSAALCCACSFGMPQASRDATGDATDESSGASQDSSGDDHSVSTTMIQDGTSSATDGSSGPGSSDGSESGSSESGSDGSSESSTGTEEIGACAFSGAPCTGSEDCGITGVCSGLKCFHACEIDADCPTGMFCFESGELGKACAGCDGDDSLCSGGAVCPVNDCAQPQEGCTEDHSACLITDECVF